MTTPAASGTLYASVADLRNVMGGTDSGTGTAAQLTDEQLTLALYAGSNRVSVYAGNLLESSTADADPPGVLHDLALDLACFWAWKTYLKGKSLDATHPAYIAYKDAVSVLEDVRDGKILLSVAAAPGVGDQVGTVINRIPAVFTGLDSNTRINPMTGTLQADSPFWTPGSAGLVGGGGAVYEG